ncbi:hypothetical protein VOLCADRAFT_95715 [Volvox carteri f. nagariensis]|uniref:Uncharacterized protein n=1 Tax=Volvox carteri f. nagariensis TaxID=3068 RepID=D8U870_VOLCA|nr:uncharacterized protein VOLCADRAFT_95715 [Volvox carteri f. nagariensis]EFJ44089.1 hypothetical protein VOLCADRAFT_95715 [Volvox carteri f. nagariensis]|eukprot:XP_002954890.1 hypothetical protein VOLCADRAFT_95715 [Volvox carteri f. nagariensis]
MAELLHYSKSGVQGPMANAPPAQHVRVNPHLAPFTPPWVPASPEPQADFAVDAGVRHKQVEGYVGASAAAAAALGDDQIGREKRRTPSGPAAPYQKAAAQRSAERAIRPWDPISGAGERAGAALLQVPGSNAGVAAFAAPDVPALFVPPPPSAVAAVAAAAGRVARGGQGQRAAAGAVSAAAGAPPRELWAAALFQQPPKYCTACRGGHDPAKVGNPEWQPYSPAVRLGNLQMLDTKFRRAMVKGQLCFRLSESLWDPVRWVVQPAVMPPVQFRQQLALAFDGVREGHEPFRFLASRAAEALLAAASTPVCGFGCRQAILASYDPPLPTLLHTLSRVLAVFRSHRSPLELPCPVCLPPTGSFSGSGAPHGSVSRACKVCGAPVYREWDRAAAREAAAAEPLVWGTPALAAAAAAAVAPAGNGAAGGGRSGKPGSAAAVAAGPSAAAADPSAVAATRLPGRMCQRYTLEALIEEVLGLLAAGGGEEVRRAIRSYVPGFTYYPPQDQPPCRTVEELLEESWKEAAVRQLNGDVRPRLRRPKSAPPPPTRRARWGPGPSPPGRPSTARSSGSRSQQQQQQQHDRQRQPAPGAVRSSAVVVVVSSATAVAAPGGSQPRGRREEGADGKTSPSPPPATTTAPSPAAGRRRGRQPATTTRRRQSEGGGDGEGDGGGNNSGLQQRKEEGDLLARWDGIEFRDVPYKWTRGGAPLVLEDGGGGGGSGGAKSTAAVLRISTPVPVFDSVHDPLYRMLLLQSPPDYSGCGRAWWRRTGVVALAPGSGGHSSGCETSEGPPPAGAPARGGGGGAGAAACVAVVGNPAVHGRSGGGARG